MSKKIFFCGIGGSGMSGLARYFLDKGDKVFGSDIEETNVTKSLKEEGAVIYNTQIEDNIMNENFDLFIYTEAVGESNIEYITAKEKNIKMKKYFEVLGDISKNYYTITVAGTHGKSSTTAMIATILKDSGVEVTSILGANVIDWDNKNFLHANKNASDGNPLKNYLILEACEYRESFLNLNPNGIVITNIEYDHLDYFKSTDEYFNSFKKFLSKLPKFGFFSAFLKGENIINILPENFHPRKFNAEEELNNLPLLKVFGDFQKKNALSALSAVSSLKLDKEKVKESLKNFNGLERRFEIKGKVNDITVVDDYAHHPTSVKLIIKTAREYIKKNKLKKLWIIFQPHQYSRTSGLFNDFTVAFKDADEVLIPNIYASRDSETDMKLISAENFAEEIHKDMTKVEKKRSNIWGRGTKKRGEIFYKKQAKFTNGFKNTLTILKDYANKGDLVLFIGAGDIDKLSNQFLNSSF